MILFCFLLLAHLLYDFHWQGEFVGLMKAKSWFILGVHSATYALCIWATLYFFGADAWWKLAWLLISHFLVDMWKCRETELPQLGSALWIDQGLHLLVLVSVM